MCQKCADAVCKWYPEFSEEDQGELLWGATCFPFGEPEDVDRRLQELRTHTDGTLSGAMQYAEAQQDRAMAQMRELEGNDE